MTLGTATVIRGNALALPLPDASVDLICTSPPYFGLRSYQDASAHYQGQIGSEATPAEFLDALIAATAEMVRVLKPSGSLFVNLGDKYAGSGGGGNGSSDGLTGRHARPPRHNVGIPTKSLMGIPWRYAIACIDQLGLILRAEIIWSKPNGLPESVTDRVRRSHEYWFHFTKQPRYFAAVDEIREPHAEKTLTHRGGGQAYGNDRNPDNHWGNPNGNARIPDPLGKLPGSVWTVPTQPLEVPPHLGIDHFAAYPMEWPRRIIQGWTPTGICVACGEGRRPVTQIQLESKGIATGRQKARALGRETEGGQGGWDSAGYPLGKQSAVITGYSCGCATPTAPTRPAICLDPFGGTGTTALVAKALGRHGITIDLSADYCRLAEWRCNNPQQLAQALQVEKPDVIPLGQLSLFEEAT